MPEIESPPTSGDATGAPADWIQHDITPAEEGWFIVAHWPGVELADTVFEFGYVKPDPGFAVCVDGINVGAPLPLTGALYIRLPRPIHLPF